MRYTQYDWFPPSSQMPAQPSKPSRKIIGAILILFACVLFVGSSVFFFGFPSTGKTMPSPTEGITVSPTKFTDVDTDVGTQGVVADNIDIDDEDYWIARVTGQDVESWSVPASDTSSEALPAPYSSSIAESDSKFFPKSKVMYSMLDMPENTRYVMDAMRHGAECGKVYDSENYSTYEYYAGGFRDGVDFAYDSFDYNMSDYPMVLAYLASPDFMHLCYSEKGFFMFESDLFSTGCDFNAMYEAIDNKAQEICDECWEASGGDERLFVSNVYHYLARNMTYSDGIGDSIHANDIYGALLEGESKCAGMSGAMKYILDKKGVPNVIGFTDRSTTPEFDEGHAWNIVYSDGQWMCCDLTVGSKLYEEYGGYYPEEDIRYTLDNAACLIPQGQFCEAEGVAISSRTLALEEYAEKNLL